MLQPLLTLSLLNFNVGAQAPVEAVELEATTVEGSKPESEEKREQKKEQEVSEETALPSASALPSLPHKTSRTPSHTTEQKEQNLPTWYEREEPATSPIESEGGPESRQRDGKGWWIASAATTLGTVSKQYLAIPVCGAPNCQGPAIFDRVVWFGIGAMAARGGWMHGRWRSLNPQKTGRLSQDKRRRAFLGVGWGLAAVGLSGIIIDSAFVGACFNESGPYYELHNFRYTCRAQLSTAVLNLSGVLLATGTALAMVTHGYQATEAKARAKKNAMFFPWVGRRGFGMSWSRAF